MLEKSSTFSLGTSWTVVRVWTSNLPLRYWTACAFSKVSVCSWALGYLTNRLCRKPRYWSCYDGWCSAASKHQTSFHSESSSEFRWERSCFCDWPESCKMPLLSCCEELVICKLHWKLDFPCISLAGSWSCSVYRLSLTVNMIVLKYHLVETYYTAIWVLENNGYFLWLQAYALVTFLHTSDPGKAWGGDLSYLGWTGWPVLLAGSASWILHCQLYSSL